MPTCRSDRRILYRMGVHLGEMVVEGGEIDGDGVVIAARLQAQATPGGIVVSAAVREQVGDKEGLRFVDLGERMAEVGDRPLHSFALEPFAAAAPGPTCRQRRRAARRSPSCRSRT